MRLGEIGHSAYMIGSLGVEDAYTYLYVRVHVGRRMMICDRCSSVPLMTRKGADVLGAALLPSTAPSVGVVAALL